MTLFAEGRKEDRTQSYLDLLCDFAKAGKDLCPEFMAPKDHIDSILRLEGFIKAEHGAKEGSAIEKVQRFLNGEPDDEPKQPAPNSASNRIQ